MLSNRQPTPRSTKQLSTRGCARGAELPPSHLHGERTRDFQARGLSTCWTEDWKSVMIAAWPVWYTEWNRPLISVFLSGWVSTPACVRAVASGFDIKCRFDYSSRPLWEALPQQTSKQINKTSLKLHEDYLLWAVPRWVWGKPFRRGRFTPPTRPQIDLTSTSCLIAYEISQAVAEHPTTSICLPAWSLSMLPSLQAWPTAAASWNTWYQYAEISHCKEVPLAPWFTC